MKTIYQGVIAVGLILTASVAIAQGDVNDSTSTGRIDVISGENIGGAAHGGRKLLSDYRDTYHGAVASGGNVYSEYFISWPNLYARYKNRLLCNISRGSCSDRSSTSYAIDSDGLSIRKPSCNTNSMGCTPNVGSYTFYPWIR